MEPELAKKINESGIRKSTIELELEMPKNSLSGMLSGARDTPPKWEKKLHEYMDGQNQKMGFSSPDGTLGTLSNSEASETFGFNGVDVKMTLEEHAFWRLIVQYSEEKGKSIGQIIEDHMKIMPKGLSTMEQIQWRIDHP